MAKGKLTYEDLEEQVEQLKTEVADLTEANDDLQAQVDEANTTLGEISALASIPDEEEFDEE